jgi:hypothetical protein
VVIYHVLGALLGTALVLGLGGGWLWLSVRHGQREMEAQRAKGPIFVYGDAEDLTFDEYLYAKYGHDDPDWDGFMEAHGNLTPSADLT